MEWSRFNIGTVSKSNKANVIFRLMGCDIFSQMRFLWEKEWRLFFIFGKDYKALKSCKDKVWMFKHAHSLQSENQYINSINQEDNVYNSTN